MESVVTEHDGRLLARIEDDRMVFEVSFDRLEPTDVTLRFYRNGKKVGNLQRRRNRAHDGAAHDRP
jgi:hypothetical protein